MLTLYQPPIDRLFPRMPILANLLTGYMSLPGSFYVVDFEMLRYAASSLMVRTSLDGMGTPLLDSFNRTELTTYASILFVHLAIGMRKSFVVIGATRNMCRRATIFIKFHSINLGIPLWSIKEYVLRKEMSTTSLFSFYLPKSHL